MKTSQALADHRLIYALDTFQIYTGPIPETADDPPTGTLLCEMTGCKLCYDVWSTAWELLVVPGKGLGNPLASGFPSILSSFCPAVSEVQKPR